MLLHITHLREAKKREKEKKQREHERVQVRNELREEERKLMNGRAAVTLAEAQNEQLSLEKLLVAKETEEINRDVIKAQQEQQKQQEQLVAKSEVQTTNQSLSLRTKLQQVSEICQELSTERETLLLQLKETEASLTVSRSDLKAAIEENEAKNKAICALKLEQQELAKKLEFANSVTEQQKQRLTQLAESKEKGIYPFLSFSLFSLFLSLLSSTFSSFFF